MPASCGSYRQGADDWLRRRHDARPSEPSLWVEADLSPKSETGIPTIRQTADPLDAVCGPVSGTKRQVLSISILKFIDLNARY